MKNRIVCFGEVLWDIYPEFRKLGGAPFNVAAHLNKLGRSVSMISKVGKGGNGQDIRAKMKRMEMDQSFLQTDKDLHTGFVKVTLDELKAPSFEIVHPVAFDRIELEEDSLALVEQSKALVYGTLACRDGVSRNTLLALLEKSPYSVLDLNLRQSFYRFEWVDQMLANTQMLKVNQMEMNWLCTEFEMELSDVIQYLLKTYPLNQIIHTKGEVGATLYINGKQYEHAGFKVRTTDTVGAGDAFLAGYLHKFFDRESPEDCLDFATRMGSLNVSKAGAIPNYNLAELQALK